MSNQIIGRIVAKLDRGTYTYESGEQGRKMELWVSPFIFDRYTGVPSFNSRSEECVGIIFRDNRAEMLGKFEPGNDVCITYELRGRMYNDKQSGEQKNFTYVEGRYIEPYPKPSSQPAQQQ